MQLFSDWESALQQGLIQQDEVLSLRLFKRFVCRICETLLPGLTAWHLDHETCSLKTLLERADALANIASRQVEVLAQRGAQKVTLLARDGRPRMRYSHAWGGKKGKGDTSGSKGKGKGVRTARSRTYAGKGKRTTSRTTSRTTPYSRPSKGKGTGKGTGEGSSQKGGRWKWVGGRWKWESEWCSDKDEWKGTWQRMPDGRWCNVVHNDESTTTSHSTSLASITPKVSTPTTNTPTAPTTLTSPPTVVRTVTRTIYDNTDTHDDAMQVDEEDECEGEEDEEELEGEDLEHALIENEDIDNTITEEQGW